MVDPSVENGEPSYIELHASYVTAGQVMSTKKRNAKAALDYYRSALACTQKHLQSNPEDVFAEAQRALDYCYLGDATAQQGRTRDAIDLYKQALLISERLYAANPSNIEAQRDLAFVWLAMGEALFDQGKLAKSSEFYALALQMRMNIALSDPANPVFMKNIAYVHRVIGDLRSAQGRFEDAREAHLVALRKMEDAAKLSSSDYSLRSWIVEEHLRVVSVCEAMGNSSEAGRFCRLATELAEAALSESEDDAARAIDLFWCYSATGDLLFGDRPNQEPCYRLACDLLERIVALNPDNLKAQDCLALGREKLAAVLDRERALQEYNKACRILVSLIRSDRQNLTWQRDLADLFCEVGDVFAFDRDDRVSRKWYGRSLGLFRRLTHKDEGNDRCQGGVALVLKKIGELDERAGDPIAARNCFKDALSIIDRLALEEPSYVSRQGRLAFLLQQFGDVELQLCRRVSALASLQRAQSIFVSLSNLHQGDNGFYRSFVALIEKTIADISIEEIDRTIAIDD